MFWKAVDIVAVVVFSALTGVAFTAKYYAAKFRALGQSIRTETAAVIEEAVAQGWRSGYRAGHHAGEIGLAYNPEEH